MIVQQEVGGRWSGYETGCCQEVGDVVDVLVFGTSAAGEGGAES